MLHQQGDAPPYSVAFSPDGKVLAVAGGPHGRDANVLLWYADEP
jgi:hypothetical protein